MALVEIGSPIIVHAFGSEIAGYAAQAGDLGQSIMVVGRSDTWDIAGTYEITDQPLVAGKVRLNDAASAGAAPAVFSHMRGDDGPTTMVPQSTPTTVTLFSGGEVTGGFAVEQGAGWAVSANAITIPTAGTWNCIYSISMSSDGTNVDYTFNLELDGVPVPTMSIQQELDSAGGAQRITAPFLLETVSPSQTVGVSAEHADVPNRTLTVAAISVVIVQLA